jgi:hypothetical protein
MHEGIGDPQAKSCGRWPEPYRILNRSTGEIRRGRCKATNLCRYCQKLYVIETVEMLTLDAMEYAPTLWVVLTAREHLTRAECRDHLRQLRRAAQKLWPDVEWFVQVEFQRRGALHLNLLVKGVPAGDQAQLLDVLSRMWCRRVDAESHCQWIEPAREAVAVARYLTKMLAHGLKAEQAPPIGWRGHRTSQTRGYLVRPASEMRVEARRSLQGKRELWKLLQADPSIDAVTAEDVVTARLELADSDTWKLVRVQRLSALRPDSVRGERIPPPFRRRADGRATRARADVNPAQRAS